MTFSLSAFAGLKKMLLPITIVLVVLFTVYLGYRHYVGVSKENGELKSKVATLETALDIEQAAVRDLLKALEDWKIAQEYGFDLAEGMQNDANAALEDELELQRMFTEIDWDSVPADSVANAVTNRLWQRISTASDSGLYRGSAPDSATGPAAQAP